MMYLGDYAEDATLYFCWNSNDADGASITRATDGAIWVYKNDATGTEVQTGVTDTEDFDSLTGVHNCEIILTDAFYATGCDYSVILKSATIDGQTVNACLAMFSIENRFMRGTDSAALASVCTETRLAELDAANLPTDVDAILVDTGTTIPATITTAQNDLNTITGADGVNLLSATQTSIDAIETDTGEIGTAGAGLTDLGGMSTGMKAEVQVEANDALVANNLDHLMKEPTSNSATLPEVIDDTVLANILTKTDGDTSDYDFTTDSLEAIRDSQVTMGAGAITFTYSVYEDEDAAPADPIAGVTAWLTTDEAGTNVVAGPGTTNASGAVVFYVDNNTTYYVWRYKSGWNFTNPDEEAIAD